MGTFDARQAEHAFLRLLREPGSRPADPPAGPEAAPASMRAARPVHRPAARGIERHADEPGMEVYRRTVQGACLQAIVDNFPVTARMTGPAWLRSAAAHYVQTHWPTDATLARFGTSDDAFPRFLGSLPSTAPLPWLADVARADAAWMQAHLAADAPALSPATVAGWSAAQLARARLDAHPAARWIWSAHPVATIWQAGQRQRDEASAGVRPEGPSALDAAPSRPFADGSHHNEAAHSHELPTDGCDAQRAPALPTSGAAGAHGEGLLLTRPVHRVQATPIDRAAYRLLQACAEGHALADAGERLLEECPAGDLSAAFGLLLHAGALVVRDAREAPTSTA